jgi:hypothetical protein
MENQTKPQLIITFKNSKRKIQGKYSGKHQTLRIIDQWLEETGKILGKASNPGDY